MEWLGAIAAILGVIAPIILRFIQGNPAEERNEEIQEGRENIASGDVNSVSVRVDRVCGESSNNTGVVSDDEDIARRLAKITGE